jgi:hypothetical protein
MTEIPDNVDLKFEERMEGRFNTVTWMVGTCITLVVVSLGAEMAIWARLGEIIGGGQ